MACPVGQTDSTAESLRAKGASRLPKRVDQNLPNWGPYFSANSKLRIRGKKSECDWAKKHAYDHRESCSFIDHGIQSCRLGVKMNFLEDNFCVSAGYSSQDLAILKKITHALIKNDNPSK